MSVADPENHVLSDCMVAVGPRAPGAGARAQLSWRLGRGGPLLRVAQAAPPTQMQKAINWEIIPLECGVVGRLNFQGADAV